MADEATTTPAAASPSRPDRTFTQDEVNDFLAREKGKLERKYADYDDLRGKASKLAEIENANRSELEKLTGERDGLKSKVPTLEQENLRLRIAVEKGLVGDKAWIAERLRGSTEDELKTDADQFLQRLTAAPPSTPPPDVHGGVRKPAQPDEEAAISGFLATHLPQ